MTPKKKIAVCLAIGLCIVAVATAVWLGADIYRYAHRVASKDGTQQVFIVAQGEGFNHLAQRLTSRGIISSPLRFKILARFLKEDKQLKAGEYRLTANMTPRQVLDVLVNGKPFLYRMTIPEGLNLRQISDEINGMGLTDGNRFMTLATDPEVAASLGIPHPTVEGYLFPDTYYFPKNVDPLAILHKMVQHFKTRFSDQWQERARELNMTIHEVVTLASIIEKETGAPSERPIIASVFHNRLKKKMRLESDPTVIYGITNFNGNLTRKDLRTRTPYNTYMIRGLPPGPIANPGAAALVAVLYPAKTKYLFFVAKKDGTHYFSTNIKEHNRAVYQYQLRRKRKRSR